MKSQETIAGLVRSLRRRRPAQADLRPAFEAIDPFRTIGLHLQFFAAPAGHARHDKSLVVSGLGRKETNAFN